MSTTDIDPIYSNVLRNSNEMEPAMSNSDHIQEYANKIDSYMYYYVDDIQAYNKIANVHYLLDNHTDASPLTMHRHYLHLNHMNCLCMFLNRYLMHLGHIAKPMDNDMCMSFYNFLRNSGFRKQGAMSVVRFDHHQHY